jgi:hypothetical protein
MREMMNAECGVMNDEKHASLHQSSVTPRSALLHSSLVTRRSSFLHSSFIIPHSSFLLALAVFALVCACASRAGAQEVRVSPTPAPERVRQKGSITGRVMGEDGQAVAGARVTAQSSRGEGASGGNAVTGPDGAFKIENLERAPYNVWAYAPGSFDAALLEYERGARVFYRPGDTATLRVVRGGVITGRVTDARGEPAVGVRVNLVRVRTLEGTAVREVNRFMGSLERTTDDRGVYRSYGLLPGVYVVSAGGSFSSNVYGVYAHTDEAPTFYPSTTRDAATEVTVRAGEEVGAIDVRLRGDRGHAVSGTVAGVTDPAHIDQATILNLISAGSTEYQAQVYIYGRAEQDGFALDGLADGDYDLVADRYTTKDWQRVASSSRRVQVRGADVTGLKITLAPVATLSGRILFETSPAPGAKASAADTKTPTPDAKAATGEAKPETSEAKPSSGEVKTATSEARIPAGDDAKSQCAGSADALWSGAAVVARREASGATLPANEPSTLEGTPDEKGEFAFRGIAAGTYRLDFKLAEGYFVTSIRRGAQHAEQQGAPGDSAPASVVRLRQGEQVSNLVVTAAYGAASVAGSLRPAGECESCAPERLRLYLVPSERDRADDALRYAEAVVTKSRGRYDFSFDSLAPGRYTLLALPDTPRKDARPEPPAFADAASRARLRRLTEARGTPVTLRPCQHADALTFGYVPPPAGGN